MNANQVHDAPEDLLTREETARLLGVSVPTIDGYLKEKRLVPFFRYSRKAVRIPRSTVEAFRARSMVTAAG